jgi:hypothetical protein
MGVRDDDAERADARRRARSRWPIARHRLGEGPSDDLSGITTAAQRIAMMRELAETAWRLAGRPLPSYARHEIPGRIFRPGEPIPEDE